MKIFNLIKKIFPRSGKRFVKRSFNSLYDALRYYQHRRNKLYISEEIKHVVFICKGNICRSAFAEKYYNTVNKDLSIIVESCGLDVSQGNQSPAIAVQAGNEFGLDLSEHRSKSVEKCDLDEADLFILMEYKQLKRFSSSFPKLNRKAMLLRDFLPWPSRLYCNIYDPYGLDLKDFRKCFLTIKKSIDRMQCTLTS